jgi:hypothetical protein
MILWVRGLNYYENNLIVETLADQDVDRENLKVKDSQKEHYLAQAIKNFVWKSFVTKLKCKAGLLGTNLLGWQLETSSYKACNIRRIHNFSNAEVSRFFFSTGCKKRHYEGINAL